VQEKELRFLENAMNWLSEHVALSKKLAKRAYHAKRVHLLRMNTHPLPELPVAKRG